MPLLCMKSTIMLWPCFLLEYFRFLNMYTCCILYLDNNKKMSRRNRLATAAALSSG